MRRCRPSEGVFQIWLDGNLFNRKGIWLNVEQSGLSLRERCSAAPYAAQIGHYGAIPLFAGNGVPPRCDQQWAIRWKER